MPPFKDEHILIIAPGSQTTLAQLGLPESFTPARFRFPTRMFPAEKKGEWEPHRVREKKVQVTKPAPAAPAPAAAAPDGGADAQKEDQEMKDADAAPTTDSATEVKEEETVYEEDLSSDEGAVYPLVNGAITDWPCFFALLTHIYNTLSPPFHTPVMLIGQPVWTARDRETLTQFVFEKFKTPAFCLMDSALAVCYAYGTPSATVVDVGYGKVDVTAVTDYVVNEYGRGVAVPGCGGDAMTDRLTELLRGKAFTRDMCEQLKKSNICEILPAGTPFPGTAATVSQAAATTTDGPDAEAKKPSADTVARPQIAGVGPLNNGEAEEDEGVLDVATIVSGNTSEYLAKREREKAEKAAEAKKGAGGEQGKTSRLPNSKKEKATFQLQEFVKREPAEGSEGGADQFVLQKREIEVGVERFLLTTPSDSKTDDRCSYGVLDTIAAQIHHTILSVSDPSKRSELWDSLIVLGNGSKIKGFTQALLSTITQKYILSPSGTIFTSELPSAFSTPLPTGGTNTPAQVQNPGPQNHPAAHGVNPLLVAATHANNPATPNNHLNAASAAVTPQDPNINAAALAAHHRSTGHSQTPMSVKTLKPPEYFPEWKEQGGGGSGGGAGPAANSSGANGAGGAGSGAAKGGQDGRASGASGSHNVGMEEATFLGAQVAAKVVFVIDQGLSKGFLSRVEYNENGPTGIHDCSL
ncbi:Actin-like protein arp9 (SWI/SNF complex component arp9) [Arachnomyces sp. PD_36]|nr:Actin-like protein arp9 (SWI/SNF complex component arp9) [Arachnomyces sp. PD_36]